MELDGSVVLRVAGADVVVFMTATDVMTLVVVAVVVGLGSAGRPVVIVTRIFLIKKEKKKNKLGLVKRKKKKKDDGDVALFNLLLPWSSALQHTLKTTFMLWEEQRPPMRRCRSSRDDVAVKIIINSINQLLFNIIYFSKIIFQFISIIF